MTIFYSELFIPMVISKKKTLSFWVRSGNLIPFMISTS